MHELMNFQLLILNASKSVVIPVNLSMQLMYYVNTIVDYYVYRVIKTLLLVVKQIILLRG